MLAALALSLLLVPRALFTGPELDYQSSVVEHHGELVVVFERLNAGTFSGDLLVTRSTNRGASWSEPAAVAMTASNERAPSLVVVGDELVLFYLVGTPGGVYRIHRATSPDGQSWTTHGAIDLGWPTGAELNPDVIMEADGTLTMTYHRLGGASYIARSSDRGATWDTRRTVVAAASALPRITRRESDGTYLVTYQINPGNNALRLFSKSTTDPYDWSGDASPLSIDGNSHDSAPYVIVGGTFSVVYADARGTSAFNLFRRTSADGKTWSAATQLTFGDALNDVQPHVFDAARGRVLIWSRETTGTDRDLWFDPEFLSQRRRRSAMSQ
ncbi:MAG TPA: sialidase family protein [Thermoanaerobaculia bacterium]|jgi:hypothetical protein